MKVKQVRQKATIFAAGALTALLFAQPLAAHAGMFDIFSVISSTIGSEIGGTLSAMNTIASTLQKDEQTLLFPVSLINQSRSFVSTIIGSYRSWMSTVFTMQTGSAQLSQNQVLELEAMSGTTSTITNINSKIANINTMYNATKGLVPSALAAPAAHRQMIDMDDALAKDALSQSVAADQTSASLLKMANGIENQSAASSTGTAPIISASARTAELISLAGQHKLLAAMLREEAGGLAHEMGVLKQSAAQAQQANENLKAGAVTP